MFKSYLKPARLLGVPALSLLASLAAQGADTETRFSIPAQPLSQALASLSAQADVTVFAPNKILAGKQATSVTGVLTTAEALGRLLDGSGLVAEEDEKGTIVIRAAGASPADLEPGAGRSPFDQDVEEEIEELVIVGKTTNVDITASDLDRLQANDLEDIFREVPSVSVGGSIGIAQKIYVRGVEDTLLNITVDGAPQTGTLFHHIGRVSIEPELLKQVEVQAGAGEATSGFGAIGGAVRFRTKDASDLLEDGKSFGGLAKANYFSNDGYKLSLTAFGRMTDNWDVLGSYVYVDRSNMQDGAGNDIIATAAEQELAFIKVTGRFGGNQRLSLSYEHRDEEGEFGQRPNWQTLDGAILYPVDATRQTAVANYMLEASDYLNLEATAYYTKSEFAQDVYNRWGKYGAEIETYGFDLRNTSNIANHELRYGVEYRNDTVSSQYLADESVWTQWAWDPNVGRFEEKGDVFGLYFQDHWQATDALTISAGVRYDSYDMEQVTYDEATDSDGVSVNAGLLYAITPELSITAGYAEALRGKEVGDAFTLDKNPVTQTLARDLKAEKADNKEIALVYDDGNLFASATYYDSQIKDVILDQLGSGSAPQSSVFYENVGTFDADGFEFRLGYENENWRADAFFTTYDATLNGHPVEGYEHIGLANAGGDKLVVSLTYMPTSNFEIGARVTHVADLNDIEVLHRAQAIGWIDDLQTVDKPGYTVADVFLQWLPTGDDSLRISLAANNIFDKLYRDHATVADYSGIPGWGAVAGLYEPGRDIRATISFGF